MLRRLSIYFFLFAQLVVHAQMPDTELWLFKIGSSKTGSVLTKAENITKRPGYDNQPAFSGDAKKIFYVSVREDQQADIYSFDVKRGKSTIFTKTPISEYSPALTQDKKFFTSVVVESDSSQYIHYINAETGIHETKINVDSVGYYTFLNSDTVIYYKLTEPHSLRYHVKSSGEDRWLGNSPTRAFKIINRYTLLYALKDTSKTVFYKYNFLLRKGEKFCEYPSLSEDFIWHATIGLVKSEGTKLLRYDSSLQEWLPLFDLSSYGLKRITRFDIDASGNYLVVADNL